MSYVGTPPTPLQPDVDAQRPFRIFKLSEIYTGPTGTGGWVPNPEDMAVIPATQSWYLCTAVDYVSLASTMVPINVAGVAGARSQVLIGAGPGAPSQGYKCYINTKTVPYSLNFDAQLYLDGSTVVYAKLFAGNNTSSTGTVVSAIYDGTGHLVTQNLGLENVADTTINNTAVKVITPGSASSALANGSTATLVCYDNLGNPCGIYALTVVNTNFVRSMNPAQVYITGIELVTPYRDGANVNQINIPVNATLQTAMFQGKVSFSDGSHAVLPIDQSKFSLFGLSAFLPTIPDQTQNLILKYSLGVGELANEVSGPPGDQAVVRIYTINVISADNSLTVKIFALVWWNASLATPAYQVSYFLYTLDRDRYYDITSLVQFPPGQAAFSGLAAKFGVPQTLQVSVNLQQVDSTLPYYYFSTVMQITTQAAASSDHASYATVSYNGGTTIAGQGSFARYAPDSGNPGIMDLYLADSFNNTNDWLQAHYFNLLPLKSPVAEPSPPTPTHVRVKIGTQFYQLIAIEDILDPIQNVAIVGAQGLNVRMEFIQIVSGSTYELGMGYMILKSTT